MASKTQKTSKTTEPTAAQVEQVLKMEAEGAKFSEQVAKSGLTAGQVDRIVYTDTAVKRLAEVQVQGLKDAALIWHGAPTLRYLHDAPFKALAEYTVAADLTHSEWKPVCDAALLARSDEAAVAVVTEASTAMAERIAGIKAGTWKRPQFGERKSPTELVLANLDKMTDQEREDLLAALHAKQDLATK